MRQTYRRAKHGLRFARAFEDPERRFFNTEEYAYYEKIDLCAKYVKDYSSGDAHHLCCPAALLLDEYDSEHGTDYCSILAAFIDCDRNLSLTAEKLFYNRNTLKAKLEKIDDIAQESNFSLDLDDPLKRYDIRFSLYMMEYIKTFLNRSTPYSAKERVPSTSEQLEN